MCWVLLLTLLTTHDHRFTAVVCGRPSCSVDSVFHEPILVNQVGDLLLQTVILLHQKLVHSTQLSVHCLKPSRFFPLLLSTSAILEPDFDLSRLDVAENGAFSNELLSTERARFRALGVNSLESFDLLRRVSHVLAGVKSFLRRVSIVHGVSHHLFKSKIHTTELKREREREDKNQHFLKD